MNYSKVYHGKWILTGEHSVTRGNSAIVVPFKQKTCQFDYTHNNEPLNITYSGTDETFIRENLGKMWKRTLAASEIDPAKITGSLTIHNQIPIGVGLGFSAVWSVGLTELLIYLNLVPKSNLFQFAQKIEHQFHANSSSGVDIRGVLSDLPIHFTPEKRCQTFKPTWTPHIYIYNVNEKILTETTIEQVKRLHQENPAHASYVDDTMQKSVDLAIISLQLEDPIEATALMKESIRLSSQCYDHWGLISKKVKQSMEKLTAHGAVATRLSGKGLGGIIIGLWPNPLDCEQIQQLNLYSGFDF